MPRSFMSFIKKTSSFAAMADGRLRVFALNGNMVDRSLTNKVVNGNFANGTAGWLPTYATISAANNTMSVTGDGAQATTRAFRTTTIPCAPNKKVYMRATLKVTSAATDIVVQLRQQDNAKVTSVKFVSNPVQNQQYVLDGIVTIPSDYVGNANIYIQATYADAATANGKVMEVQQVMALDLTAEGLESKSAAELGTMTQAYFEGTTTLYNRVGTSLALPNALPGVAVMQASGNTLVNAVKNGNFANGTAGWSSSNTSAFTAASGVASVTGNGAAADVFLIKNLGVPSVPNKKYYAKLLVRVTNANAASLIVRLRGLTAGTVDVSTQATPVSNQWYTVSAIAQLPSDISGDLEFRCLQRYADAATANGKVMEVQQVMAIDLTAAGLESKTVAELNDLTQSYFEGVGSTVGATGSPLVNLNKPSNVQELTGDRIIHTYANHAMFTNKTLTFINNSTKLMSLVVVNVSGQTYIRTVNAPAKAKTLVTLTSTEKIIDLACLYSNGWTLAEKDTITGLHMVLEGDYTAAQVNWVEKLNSAYLGSVMTNLVAKTNLQTSVGGIGTATSNTDHWLLARKAAGSWSAVQTINKLPVKPSTTYTSVHTVDTNKQVNLLVKYYDSANTLISQPAYVTTQTGNLVIRQTITTPSNAATLHFELSDVGVSSTDYTKVYKDGIILLEGDVPVPQQYFEGTTPLYSDTVVTSRAKNLLDPTAYTPNTYITTSAGAEGDFASNTNSRTSKKIACTPGTQYTVTGGNRSAWRFEDANGVKVGWASALIVTAPANARFMYVYYSVDGLQAQVMLNEGNTALPYQPYRFAQVKLNDCVPWQYLPLEGFNGVKDEVTSRGTVIKRSGFTVLNGSESGWSQQSPPQTTNTLYFRITMANAKVAGKAVASTLSYTSTLWNADAEGIACSGSTNAVEIRISKTKATDLATLKAYLAANNLPIWYELATPIEVPLVKPFSVPTFKDGVVEITSPSILPVIDGKYRALK